MIENMSWMLRGSPHRDGSFEHQKQVLKLKLMDGIVSPVCLVGGRLSYRYLQMKKNVMNAYWGRLLGDGCFERSVSFEMVLLSTKCKYLIGGI